MKRDSHLRRTHRLAAKSNNPSPRWRRQIPPPTASQRQRALELSGGQPVTAGAASVLINHASVEPADTALFFGLPGQSWRMK